MRSPLILLGLAAAAAIAAVGVAAAPLAYTPAALADQIHNLPGLAQQPSFNMFSGYLVVDPAVNRSIFYCTKPAYSACAMQTRMETDPTRGVGTSRIKRARRASMG